MRILKSYGTDGGVIISAPEVDLEERANEPVFIEFDGLPVPFFIEEVTPRGGAKYFVKLEDIDSLAAAEELVGKEATFEEDEEDLADEIIGYTLCNQDGTPAGEITAYEDIPGNPCLEITGGTLVPCPDELIVKVDNRKKEIWLIIPDGLL
jgi:16S rRNA processing protein RimM